MSFAVQASLGDSCDVYRPASMTVKGGSSLALFRQELGLSSDFKILLIYDISTSVFPSTPLTPRRQTPSWEMMAFDKIVCLFTCYFHHKGSISPR